MPIQTIKMNKYNSIKETTGNDKMNSLGNLSNKKIYSTKVSTSFTKREENQYYTEQPIPKLTFRVPIPGLDEKDRPAKEVFGLVNPATQDTHKWLKDFQKAKMDCKWSDETVLGVLKNLLYRDEDLELITNYTSFGNAITTLINHFYPQADFTSMSLD